MNKTLENLKAWKDGLLIGDVNEEIKKFQFSEEDLANDKVCLNYFKVYFEQEKMFWQIVCGIVVFKEYMYKPNFRNPKQLGVYCTPSEAIKIKVLFDYHWANWKYCLIQHQLNYISFHGLTLLSENESNISLTIEYLRQYVKEEN